MNPFFYAAHAHAEMFCVNDYHASLWTQQAHDDIRQLRGETLLHLRAVGKVLQSFYQFAQADDLPRRNVRDMCLADKRQRWCSQME